MFTTIGITSTFIVFILSTDDDFIRSVVDIGVKKAVYLDMGGKSSYSKYRNNDGKSVNLFGKLGEFVHSWIAFYK